MQYLLRICLPDIPTIRALRRAWYAREGEPCQALSAKDYKLIRVAEDVFAGRCAQPGDITCDDGPGREVTFDNGGEFAEHETLTSETGVQAFFCDPHSPWQRGAIENTNGVIRRDMPRKTDMADYSPADIDDIMWAGNSTPRKCLAYRTPAEAFLKNLTIALEL